MSEGRFVLQNEIRICRQLIDMAGKFFLLVRPSKVGVHLSERETILLAHILRARKMAKVCILLGEKRVLEDLWTISRSLSELVINTGYLHIATDQEVTNYIYFDGQKVPSQATRLMTHRQPESLPTQDLVDSINNLSSSSRVLTGLEDNSPSWSRLNLAARAQEADKHYQANDFYTLYLTAAPYGNAGTHSTMLSLWWSVNELAGGQKAQMGKHGSMLGSTMHTCVLALNLLCLALNEKYNLAMKSVILAACR